MKKSTLEEWTANMPIKYQTTTADPLGLPLDKPPKGWQPPPPDWEMPADFIKPPWWDKAI